MSNLNTSIKELTENTEPDTLWLSEGNFKTAGPILANYTLAFENSTDTLCLFLENCTSFEYFLHVQMFANFVLSHLI